MLTYQNIANPHRWLKTSQIYRRPHELEKSWVSRQGYGKNMLILENGEKLMENGLETKAPDFLVWLALPYPQKSKKTRIKQNLL